MNLQLYTNLYCFLSKMSIALLVIAFNLKITIDPQWAVYSLLSGKYKSSELWIRGEKYIL